MGFGSQPPCQEGTIETLFPEAAEKSTEKSWHGTATQPLAKRRLQQIVDKYSKITGCDLLCTSNILWLAHSAHLLIVLSPFSNS